jgi:hypothetical protein
MDHVQLAAPPGTEDALRAFYVDVLGLAERAKPPVLAAIVFPELTDLPGWG